jgi:hypothetical protein
MYKLIIALCSKIFSKKITPFGQNIEICNLKLLIHMMTIRLQSFHSLFKDKFDQIYTEVISVGSRSTKLK